MTNEELNYPVVYLKTPVTIKGITIPYTEEGVDYLIEHYSKMLTYNPINKLTGPARSVEDTEYMKSLIIKFKQYKELYQSVKPFIETVSDQPIKLEPVKTFWQSKIYGTIECAILTRHKSKTRIVVTIKGEQKIKLVPDKTIIHI